MSLPALPKPRFWPPSHAATGCENPAAETTLVNTAGVCRLRIMHLAGEVGTDSVVAAQTDGITTTIARSVVAGPWQTRLRNHCAGQFPSAQYRVRQTLGLREDRNLPDIVRTENLATIE